MEHLDELRRWAARKKKADSLSAEVREEHAAAYREVCEKTLALTLETLADVVCAVHGSPNRALQDASGVVAKRYLDGDVDAFIRAVEQFLAVAGDKFTQMGFEVCDAPAWEAL